MNNAYVRGYLEGYMSKEAVDIMSNQDPIGDPEVEAMEAEIAEKKRAVELKKLENQNITLDTQLQEATQEGEELVAAQAPQEGAPEGQQSIGVIPGAPAPEAPNGPSGRTLST